MNLQVETPKKKKTKNSTPSLPCPSFSLLPDEITVSCLARISSSYYETLSIVSGNFRSLVSSTELYAERSQLGNTEQCLYVCFRVISTDVFYHWFRLWINPNRTLLNSSVIKKKKTIGPLLVPIPPSNFHASPIDTITLGSEIYGIKKRPFGVWIFDCRNHAWRDAPSMKVAREFASSCFYDGKIYVLGGYKGYEDGRRKALEDDEPWAEVFDTKTQTWECLPDPGSEICKCIIYKVMEIEGKIEFEDWITKKRYAYNTKQGKWVRCDEKASASFPTIECVIENVSYRFFYTRQSVCQWYDIKDGKWKDVEGLDSLRQKYMPTDGSSVHTGTKLASCGGKLLLLWELGKRHATNGMKKIWCAEIMVEKRDGGEVWGNVEWVDLVHTAPPSWHLSHCLPVSV